MDSIHKSKKIRLYLFSLIFLILTPISSCGKDKTEGFGVDADYFLGMQLLSQGNEKEATKKLQNCAKNGSLYCAQKSCELLLNLQSISEIEKNKLCTNLQKKYPDTASTLIAAKYYRSINSFEKILSITGTQPNSEQKNIPQNIQDQLTSLRLQALNARKSETCLKEIEQWFLSNPISSAHADFYTQVLLEPIIFNYSFQTDFDSLVESPSLISPTDLAIAFRMKIYRKNYASAYKFSSILISFIEQKKLPLTEQLASDIGKAFLYGSNSFLENALFLEQKSQSLKNTAADFYFNFYSGRLFEKAKNYAKASAAFEKSFASTNVPAQKDNALWYLFTVNSKVSHTQLFSIFQKYKNQITDFEYFDDFFDTQITSFFANGRWNAFCDLRTITQNYCSKETNARFSYLYARLIQEGVLQVESPRQEINHALNQALDSGTSLYYKLLAAQQLNYSYNQTQDLLFRNPYLPQENKSSSLLTTITPKNAAAEILLKGYAHFGFPELIYSEWLNFYKEGISEETSTKIAAYLYNCGKEQNNNKYTVQSLRIACRIHSSASEINKNPLPSKEQLKLMYPENFSNYVDTYCKKYNIPSSVIYALIRSESFFDVNVYSSAGAIGLTQLMESTASDVARKLKKTDYSLTDPETNIEIGTFYLAELIRRCDNSLLKAFFSYNAGITTVRRWLTEEQKYFGQKKNMSGDLFLECLSYGETREYGRKLVSASLIYELLYSDDIHYSSMIEEIF
ncbi:MAG: lytic transglycosylase domain-containing protein [Treponema sp.]|nr:lytic transglycosylase domain-containing protein [Treponema sp.]